MQPQGRLVPQSFTAGSHLEPGYSVITRQNMDISPAHSLEDIPEATEEEEKEEEEEEEEVEEEVGGGYVAGYSIIRKEDVDAYVSDGVSEEEAVSSEEGRGEGLPASSSAQESDEPTQGGGKDLQEEGDKPAKEREGEGKDLQEEGDEPAQERGGEGKDLQEEGDEPAQEREGEGKDWQLRSEESTHKTEEEKITERPRLPTPEPS